MENKVMKLSATTIIVGAITFAACASIAFFLLQGRGEDSHCNDASGEYVMMFAFQYAARGYYFKVDNDLFIWVCPGLSERDIVTEEDFANPEFNWRGAQITQEDFDYLVSLVKETPLRSESSLGDDFAIVGAWTITVFYDSSIARGLSHACRFECLTEKLVELSPIRVDLTVWGGS